MQHLIPRPADAAPMLHEIMAAMHKSAQEVNLYLAGGMFCAGMLTMAILLTAVWVVSRNK